MDESRRAVLQAELDAAVRQRDELTVVIEWLSKSLGVAPNTSEAGRSGGQGETTPPPPLTAEPASLVGEGEFFGKSSTHAAVSLLERVGQSRPLKTAEIFAAIKKGGVDISTADVLYRSLFRDPRFLKVGKSLWGLSEWYPPSARNKAKAAESGEDAALRADDPTVVASPPPDTAEGASSPGGLREAPAAEEVAAS